MGYVVITYDEQAFTTAHEIARELEIAGYFTWYRWRDGCGGASLVGQCERRIAEAGAVIPIISKSLASGDWLAGDIERARKCGKDFIVVLRSLTREQLRRIRPEWTEAFASCPVVSISSTGVRAAVPRLVAALRSLGIEPRRSIELPPGLADLVNRYRLPAVVDVFEAIYDCYIARMMPYEASVKLKAIPLEYTGNIVVVAMSDPSRAGEVCETYFSDSYGIEPVLATEESIVEAIERVHKPYDTSVIEPLETDNGDLFHEDTD
ncbi:MAG: TIR domain-containing protein [Acidobacteriota bacterium]